MKINFISNQNLNVTSGGWSGINFNMHKELCKYFDVHYVGPINPKPILFEKFISKTKRVMNRQGNFYFFSNNRLNKISSIVDEKIHQDVCYNFYFGQTPWILHQNDNYPKGVYMDADFKTYLNIFSEPKKFGEKDIFRIMKLEEQWLQQCKHIFIGSEWAWQEMIKNYDLNESQKIVLHTGGNINLPKKDSFDKKINLLFISLNFEKKGGFVCVEAFNIIKEKYSNAELTIIGEKPPNQIIDIKGVNYIGYLDKKEPEDIKQFNTILSNSFLLIHPTIMDTMGAVLIEAAYFGCPSIAPDSFGIPELVIHNKTGVIVKDLKPLTFAKCIEELISNPEKYYSLRKNAWNYSRQNLTWSVLGERIKETIINNN